MLSKSARHVKAEDRLLVLAFRRGTQVLKENCGDGGDTSQFRRGERGWRP